MGYLHTPGLATFVLCAFTTHQSVLIGHDEFAQTVHYGVEHVGGNDAVTQQFFLPLCPRRGSSFRLLTLVCRYGDAGWKRLI
jgi:hypothetical protein